MLLRSNKSTYILSLVNKTKIDIFFSNFYRVSVFDYYYINTQLLIDILSIIIMSSDKIKIECIIVKKSQQS